MSTPIYWPESGAIHVEGLNATGPETTPSPIGVRYNHVEGWEPQTIANFEANVARHSRSDAPAASERQFATYSTGHAFDGMQATFSWVAPEARETDEQGRTFIGGMLFTQDRAALPQAPGLHTETTVLGYSLFDTPGGKTIESQVGTYRGFEPPAALAWGHITHGFEVAATYHYDPQVSQVYASPVTPELTNAEVGAALQYANACLEVDGYRSGEAVSIGSTESALGGAAIDGSTVGGPDTGSAGAGGEAGGS